MKKATVTAVIEIEIPLVPNYLRTTSGVGTYRVGDFTDAELTAVGREWTRKLIENAERQRKQG